MYAVHVNLNNEADLKESDENVWGGVAEENDREEGAEAAVQDGRTHVD